MPYSHGVGNHPWYEQPHDHDVTSLMTIRVVKTRILLSLTRGVWARGKLINIELRCRCRSRANPEHFTVKFNTSSVFTAAEEFRRPLHMEDRKRNVAHTLPHHRQRNLFRAFASALPRRDKTGTAICLVKRHDIARFGINRIRPRIHAISHTLMAGLAGTIRQGRRWWHNDTKEHAHYLSCHIKCQQYEYKGNDDEKNRAPARWLRLLSGHY